jgi:hypothetical protein
VRVGANPESESGFGSGVRQTDQYEQSIVARPDNCATPAPDHGQTSGNNPTEQEILSWICELRDMCRSLHEIATTLTAQRIKPEPSRRLTTTSLRLVVNRREPS